LSSLKSFLLVFRNFGHDTCPMDYGDRGGEVEDVFKEDLRVQKYLILIMFHCLTDIRSLRSAGSKEG